MPNALSRPTRYSAIGPINFRLGTFVASAGKDCNGCAALFAGVNGRAFPHPFAGARIGT